MARELKTKSKCWNGCLHVRIEWAKTSSESNNIEALRLVDKDKLFHSITRHNFNRITSAIILYGR